MYEKRNKKKPQHKKNHRYIFRSVCLFISVFLSACPSVPVYPSLSVCISSSVSVSLCLCLSSSVTLSLSVSVSIFSSSFFTMSMNRWFLKQIDSGFRNSDFLSTQMKSGNFAVDSRFFRFRVFVDFFAFFFQFHIFFLFLGRGPDRERCPVELRGEFPPSVCPSIHPYVPRPPAGWGCSEASSGCSEAGSGCWGWLKLAQAYQRLANTI